MYLQNIKDLNKNSIIVLRMKILVFVEYNYTLSIQIYEIIYLQ